MKSRMQGQFGNVVRALFRRRDLVLLFLIALLLRSGFLLFIIAENGTAPLLTTANDTIAYCNIAKGIVGLAPFDHGAVLMFGVGYGAFVSLFFLTFGITALPILIVQIIISSIGCLVIVELGQDLTDSRPVGIAAGYLAAVSFTSISMATIVLSDCLFFFLLVLGTLLFLKGLKSRGTRKFVLSGLCIGVGILVRAIGQYWPLVMILFIFILPLPRRGRWTLTDRLRLARCASFAPLIAMLIASSWMIRNHLETGLPMLSFATAGGPGNVAMLALAKVFHRDVSDIGWEITENRRRQIGHQNFTFAEHFRLLRQVSWSVMMRYPRAFFSTQKALAWENIIAMNEISVSQLPKHRWDIFGVFRWMQARGLQAAVFYLSTAGLLMLLIDRRWAAFLILGITLLYFAVMIGCTQWQGSRLFYPGQIAWSILIAYLIISIISKSGTAIRYFLGHARLDAAVK